MVFAMARPVSRSASSFKQFRKCVPEDIQRLAKGQRIDLKLPSECPGKPDLIVSAKIGSEVYFSLRTSDPSLVNRRQAAAIDQLEALFKALRDGFRWLSHKERVAFAGLAYHDLVNSFEDFPGEAGVWKAMREADERALSSPERAEAWFGPCVDQLAIREGFLPDPESRTAMIREVAQAYMDAASQLKRNAMGDHSPDPGAARFPPWEGFTPAPASVSINDVFERWKRERQPSASTVSTWRGCVAGFAAHLGHEDMARVTRADVVAWKDALIDRNLSPKTIAGGHLATLNTLYRFAVENGLVSENPVEGVKLRHKRRAGASRLPYDDPEVARILSLSRLEELSYRRWLPWLMALSGARVGEIAQLWGRRIVAIEGIPSMHIAPAEDGGSLKNEGSERTIPIHPAILDQNFLKFVASKGDGPLFYNRRASGQKHPSKGVANHLASWIRSLGFTDTRKAPNHAFRHWFKSTCMKEGIQNSLADAIQGHRGKRGEADRYRHADVRTMAEVIARLKVPA